jgi:hypothetical protein
MIIWAFHLSIKIKWFKQMKTETELNKKILVISMAIRSEYPELMKFLNEMPVTIPDQKNPEINTKILEDYLNSLQEMFKKYAPNHQSLID